MRSSKPKFTKRDYEWFAEVLGYQLSFLFADDSRCLTFIAEVAQQLKGTNPSYDSDRFYDAACRAYREREREVVPTVRRIK